MNNQSSQETFKLKSLIAYIVRHIAIVIVSALVGVVLLSAWNVKKGRSLSESVKDKDTISLAELERSRSDLEVARNNYANSQTKLETQKTLVEEYKKNLEEFEGKYKEDIYIVSSPQRNGVKTVYQFRANNEGAIDQTINGMKNAFEMLYDELASHMGGEYTPYNMQRLFAVEFNTGTNQIIIKFSFDDAESVQKAVGFYHNWLDEKFKEYEALYPEAELTMEISDENFYEYYDNDIFNEQRNSDNNRISLQNNIQNATNAITSAQNEISSYSAKILELEEVVRKNEALRDNTVVISEDEGKLISKSSVIIYTILGAVAGMIVSIIGLCYAFMYGRELRDAEDLEAKLGVPVLASFEEKKEKGLKAKFDLFVDRLFGLGSRLNKNDQLAMLQTELKLLSQKNGIKRLALVGTCDFSDQKMKAVVDACIDYLKAVGIELTVAGDPLKESVAVSCLSEADGAIVMGQTGVSRSKDLRNLRSYLETRKVLLIGAVNL